MSYAKSSQWSFYDSKSFYDEMFDRHSVVRPHYESVYRQFSRMKASDLAARQSYMNRQMVEEGITFTLYSPGQEDATERTIPFDFIPRIIPAGEWELLRKGLVQRVKALNLFNWDIYHGQQIVREGIIPRKMIVGNRYFRPEMAGLQVPGQIYVTTGGIDLIRNSDGSYYVLEDNLRSPSGFSYLFKSRSLMSHLMPELFGATPVLGVEESCQQFLSSLRFLAPSGKSDPVIALLTPGSFNSAYYEHAFLAQQMGIHLVEGRDLFVMDHKVFMRGLKGPIQVDVIYRRIDDDYLDPLVFNPTSVLGVPGLMNAYRAGNVAIANAPGTGVSDDKAVYAYVPEMIRYYLNEEPILNNVPTYILARPEEREYVLERLPEMVVKETSLSGGYGMLIGPHASEKEILAFADAIRLDPEKYIAQPTMQLSRSPVMVNGSFVPRHIDLRAFVLMGRDVHVIPGGLTRVAMTEGSLVVNSSQGGGCKDTWVLGK
jgi:uncharacterized circularly permuted ATP-grasp superfamily protein